MIFSEKTFPFVHHHHINGSHCMLTCMCFKLPFADLSHPPKVQANKSSSLPTSSYNITYCNPGTSGAILYIKCHNSKQLMQHASCCFILPIIYSFNYNNYTSQQDMNTLCGIHGLCENAACLVKILMCFLSCMALENANPHHP